MFLQTKAPCEIALTSCGCLPHHVGTLSFALHLPKGPSLTKEDKEALRQKELKQMKAKYGLQVSVIRTSSSQFKPSSSSSSLCSLLITSVLFCQQSSEYEEAKALKNPRYKDRAESRRQTVGSEGVFQRDDAPASVHK